MLCLTTIYVWKCAECNRTETVIANLEHSGFARFPDPPSGWEEIDGRVLCEAHTRSTQPRTWGVIHGSERRNVDPVVIPDRRLACPGCHWASKRRHRRRESEPAPEAA